jgi:hypothetical protein
LPPNHAQYKSFQLRNSQAQLALLQTSKYRLVVLPFLLLLGVGA